MKRKGQKKSKLDTPDTIVPQPKMQKENVADKNNNLKFELSLSPVYTSDLGNEAFRKFINLAPDCAVQFKKGPKNTGLVKLYFGDYLLLQSTLQRLAQLPSLAGTNVWVQGEITCLKIVPQNKTDGQKWRHDPAGSLLFSFCADKAHKLRQLLMVKGRKGADRESKKYNN